MREEPRWWPTGLGAFEDAPREAEVGHPELANRVTVEAGLGQCVGHGRGRENMAITPTGRGLCASPSIVMQSDVMLRPVFSTIG